MATTDLQPAVEEGQSTGRDMEKAPEVRNAPIAQFGLRIAEYAIESGTVRVGGFSDTRLQRGGLRASDSGH